MLHSITRTHVLFPCARVQCSFFLESSIGRSWTALATGHGHHLLPQFALNTLALVIFVQLLLALQLGFLGHLKLRSSMILGTTPEDVKVGIVKMEAFVGYGEHVWIFFRPLYLPFRTAPRVGAPIVTPARQTKEEASHKLRQNDDTSARK